MNWKEGEWEVHPEMIKIDGEIIAYRTVLNPKNEGGYGGPRYWFPASLPDRRLGLVVAEAICSLADDAPAAMLAGVIRARLEKGGEE